LALKFPLMNQVAEILAVNPGCDHPVIRGRPFQAATADPGCA
jgi:hypothetical protein